ARAPRSRLDLAADVDEVAAPQLGCRRVVSAEQDEVVRICELRAPAADVLDHAPPERDLADRRCPPKPRDRPKERLRRLARPKRVDTAIMAAARSAVAAAEEVPAR